MFWGVAEPVTHLNAPEPAGAITPRSADAAAFALTSVYMHWSFLPYAVYCFAGLVMAMMQPSSGHLSVAGPLKRVWPDLPAGLLSVLDSVALFALVAGVASSLGTGILSLAGGYGTLTDTTTTPLLTFIIMAALVASFLASSISGLQRGVAVLSDINTRVFFLFIAGVALVFPPSGFADLLASALADFPRVFTGRALAADAVGATQWYRDWTTFYLSNWYAWAPVTAIFLAHIARGYTVRAFILVNFLLPSLFAILWLSLLGGAALDVDMASGVISTAMDRGGVEAGLYALIEMMPLPALVVPLFLAMSFLSFVTAADSNTLSIITLCTRRDVDAATSRRLKLMWGILLGLTAWLMITVAGIDGLRILSAVGGFPALLLLLANATAFIIWLQRERPHRAPATPAE